MAMSYDTKTCTEKLKDTAPNQTVITRKETKKQKPRLLRPGKLPPSAPQLRHRRGGSLERGREPMAGSIREFVKQVGFKS